MKKILVSLVLLFSFVVGTSALSLTPQGAAEYNAANYLADLGIIKDVRPDIDITGTEYELIGGGKDLAIMEAYRLGDTITRKEVMKVVMKLSGKDIVDQCNGTFLDVVSDWGCKYIEAALGAGYIAANATFRPDDNITKTEAMKLVFKAKGVEKVNETDNWQKDYADSALEYGIVEEAYSDYNADATRGWIFAIATATIEKEVEIKEMMEIKKMSDEAEVQ